ncbi:Siderophore biosynthesis regulatory protein URBS1 [Smittium culicis]|uniref:Siderophore biosynthesis regulatory protein URBS1 n=1 Tax=Smittium culicis TaxID=133412 RepID=A0A1R1YH05_9FUNG|nr:Siderophore biosynthesis regulatory protein URBS1 [Smittium culicis]
MDPTNNHKPYSFLDPISSILPFKLPSLSNVIDSHSALSAEGFVSSQIPTQKDTPMLKNNSFLSPNSPISPNSPSSPHNIGSLPSFNSFIRSLPNSLPEPKPIDIPSFKKLNINNHNLDCHSTLPNISTLPQKHYSNRFNNSPNSLSANHTYPTYQQSSPLFPSNYNTHQTEYYSSQNTPNPNTDKNVSLNYSITSINNAQNNNLNSSPHQNYYTNAINKTNSSQNYNTNTNTPLFKNYSPYYSPNQAYTYEPTSLDSSQKFTSSPASFESISVHSTTDPEDNSQSPHLFHKKPSNLQFNYCTNCKTIKTPLWRRDNLGKQVCNACGLYQKSYGKTRPVDKKKLDSNSLILNKLLNSDLPPTSSTTKRSPRQSSAPVSDPISSSSDKFNSLAAAAAAASAVPLNSSSSSSYTPISELNSFSDILCPGNGSCNGKGGGIQCSGCPSYNQTLIRNGSSPNERRNRHRKSIQTPSSSNHKKKPYSSRTSSPSPPSAPKSTPSSKYHSTTICYNCKADHTPLWRRDDFGNIICNACGLYYKLHKQHRPASMKKNIIKRRNRIPNNQDP